jgi:hypothetical protein
VFLAIVATVGGLVMLVAGINAATSSVPYTTAPPPRPVRTYDCGTVASPKDVRDLAPRRGDVPRRFAVAYQHCATLRSDRTRRAAILLVAGAILLIAVLAGPALSRWKRRRRHRTQRTF